jgi:hypothetical protein
MALATLNPMNDKISARNSTQNHDEIEDFSHNVSVINQGKLKRPKDLHNTLIVKD